MIKKVNGNIFHISNLDFQGDNKKFYITYHPNNGFNEFDLVINKNWIDTIGVDSVEERIKYVLFNPKKALVNKLGKLIKIYKKLKYYRDKALENKYKKNIESIGNIELTLIEKFNSLNESGQARALDYLNDLTEMNRYKIEV